MGRPAQWLGRQWLSLLLVLTLTQTAWGQSQAWRSKEEVAALSRRIDDYIASIQKEAGVLPAPPADHGAFYRRLHIDLAGVIPEYTQARGYIQDEDPDKLWDRSERLLEDKTYGKHFAAVLRAAHPERRQPASSAVHAAVRAVAAGQPAGEQGL